MNEIGVTGFHELKALLEQLPARIARNTVARAVYAGAVIVRNDARSRVTVKTGKLKRSIRIKRKRSRRGVFEVIYSVYPKEFYGYFVEHGTRAHEIKPKNKGIVALGKDGRLGKLVHHPGGKSKPFLKPSFNDNIPKIIEAMRVKLKEGIEREGAKKR